MRLNVRPGHPRRRAATTRVRRTRRPLLAAAAALAALVTACSGPGGSSPTSPGDTEGAAPGFPVTITSCGRTLTFDAPPRRVAILSPMIARDLVALGLEDRIVGQSGTDFFVPPPETADVPVLSTNNLTSTESLLGARPDLVISDLAYRLDPAQQGASLEQLEQAGVQSYVSAGGCTTNYTEGWVKDVFTDLENLGRIFGVQPQADALAEKLRADLADVERRVADRPTVSAFMGTVYGGEYYPVTGIGLDALGLAGGTSVFPEVEDPNASLSKEEITARDPQVFIRQNSYPGSFDEQQEAAALRADFPTTAAVRDDRIHFIGYLSSALPGSAIETVGAVRELASFLHPTAFQE